MVFLKSIAINLTFPGVGFYMSWGEIDPFTPITISKILLLLFYPQSPTKPVGLALAPSEPV